MIDLFTDRGARFSACRRYRYALWRTWDASKAAAVFIMLNPSTADETENDPTVERCERRARAMGFGGLRVVNLFGFRSTQPLGLHRVGDPVGQHNDKAILDACTGAGLVVCGWGKHGSLNGRDQVVLKLLASAGVAATCLGLNGDGSPKHPLYIPYTQKPVPFGAAH